MSHRKLLEGSSGGKLAPLATSPDETPSTTTVSSSENTQLPAMRRPSVTTLVYVSALVVFVVIFVVYALWPICEICF